MAEILTFAPRPKPAAAAPAPAPEPLSAEALRAHLEEIGQAALDLFESVRAVLDAEDGDTDLEDGGDAEPSLAAPEGHDSQIGWCRGGDEDREAEAALPEVAVKPAAIVTPLPPLRWSGAGNVVAAAGVALFDLLERA